MQSEHKMLDDFPIEEGLKNNPITAPSELLQSGIDIYYGDDRYPHPEMLIRESPDGTKTLVKFTNDAWQVIKIL